MAAVIRRLLWHAALAAGLLSAPFVCPSAQTPSEYQVKAAYLYSFARFVEWPAAAGGADDPFVMCVIGTDPFGAVLDEATANGVVRNRPIRVRRVVTVAETSACHTLFIGESEDVRLGKLLDSLENRPLLTVSDIPQFAQRGGMIGFFLQGNRVRFSINIGATQQAGLMLNSELLRVAAGVIDSRPRP